MFQSVPSPNVEIKKTRKGQTQATNISKQKHHYPKHQDDSLGSKEYQDIS